MKMKIILKMRMKKIKIIKKRIKKIKNKEEKK